MAGIRFQRKRKRAHRDRHAICPGQRPGLEGATVKAPICSRCGSADVKLRKQIISNGDLQIAWRCMNCQRWAEQPMKWLAHTPLRIALERKGYTIDDIPTIEDYSDCQPCIICGAPGESHHWAPQAFEIDFGEDWIQWPIEALCLEHHRQWHSIVTPSLVFHNDAEKKDNA